MGLELLLKHKGKLLVGILIGALFLLYAIKDINWELTKTDFSKLSVIDALEIAFAIFLFFVVKCIRWKIILKPVRDIPTLKLFSPMMAGVFLNVVLSIFVGEIARSFLVGHRFKVSKSAIFASVLVERIVDVAILLFLLAMVLAFSQFDIPNVNIGLYFTLTALVAIILVSLVIWKEPTIEWLYNKQQHLKDRWIMRIESGIEGLRSITNPKLLFVIVLISIVQWLIMAWANYKSITAIGIQVPFSAGILIMVVIAFALIMPQSPGHIGVIEFGYVFSLSAYGVHASDALAAAIIYHVIYLLTMGITSIPALRLLSEKNHA